MKLARTFVCFLGVMSLISCDKKGEDENKNGPGGGAGSSDDFNYSKVIINSSNLSLTSSGDTLANCEFSMDIYRGEGSCLSPIELSGWAAQVDFVTDISGRGPTRILGESELTAKKGAILSGGGFDFNDPASSAFTGNNTLWEEYDVKAEYPGVAVKVAYLKFKALIKDKYVTTILAGVDQPFEDFAEESCELTPEEKGQSRYSDVNVLPGMTFKRGDFLFCVKDSAEEECEAADFAWLDTTNDALTNERPDSPKSSHHLTNNEVSCLIEADRRINFNFREIALYASIPEEERFILYSDFSHGSMSHQWKDQIYPLGKEPSQAELAENEETPEGEETAEGEETEEDEFQGPYSIYYYEANGEETVGTELTTEIDFDASNSIFIEDMREADVTAASLEEVLKKLNIKSQWAFDKKSEDNVEGGNSDHYAGMIATVKVTLTGGTEAPKNEDEL